MRADVHPQEQRRLEALRAYGILDTPREAEFDEVVELLSRLLGVPISVVNLIDADRQWFKAETGLGVRQTGLDISICAHAILQPGVTEVADTRQDSRFRDNPLVTREPGLRFYAGALLETSEGLPLGTLCVLDYQPRQLTEAQRDLLQLAARQVMRQLELRRLLAEERLARQRIEALLEENRLLAREVDHRVMNSLQLVSSLLGLQARQSALPAVRAALEAAEKRIGTVAAVHEQLYRGERPDRIEMPAFIGALVARIAETRPPGLAEPLCQVTNCRMEAGGAATLGLLLNELLTNVFKHAFPEGQDGRRPEGQVAVSLTPQEGMMRLRVADDGQGLPPDFDPDCAERLGMRVLAALAARLEGSLAFHRLPRGTAVDLRFPLPDEAA